MTLPPKVLRNTPRNKSTYLQLIAKATGSLQSATHELRWLQEHVHAQIPSHQFEKRQVILLELCKRRARHEPLQYILGSQPFGELDIKCRPGVLIPRPETEAYTQHIAKLLNSRRDGGILSDLATQNKQPNEQENHVLKPQKPLSILDICTGTGCIPLLLHSQLTHKFPNLDIHGWDISPEAITLSRENLEHNIHKGHLDAKAREQIHFHQLDLFNPPPNASPTMDDVDVIISNPPYISPDQLVTETTKSVREWEPRLALVPKENQMLRVGDGEETFHGVMHDVFYAQLIHLYSRAMKCLTLVMEVGDRDQALRVAARALGHEEVRTSSEVEIWRDYPDQEDTEDGDIEREVNVFDTKVLVIGAGRMRAVVISRKAKKS